MNKIVLSLSVCGLMACSDLFLGGVSNGDPKDPEIKEIEKIDTLFVPKDSIVISLSHSLNDTLFDFQYTLETDRSLKLSFEIENDVRIKETNLIGRVISASPLKLSYNSNSFESAKNEKVELLWSHDFSNKVELAQLVELNINSTNSAKYSLNFLAVLGFEVDSNAIPQIKNVKAEEYQYVVMNKNLDNESFVWDEFNTSPGDSIKVRMNSDSRITSYLITKDVFNSFLKSGKVPVNYLAKMDSLNIDLDLSIDENLSLVYLVENNTTDSLTVNDTIKIFKLVDL